MHAKLIFTLCSTFSLVTVFILTSCSSESSNRRRFIEPDQDAVTVRTSEYFELCVSTGGAVANPTTPALDETSFDSHVIQFISKYHESPQNPVPGSGGLEVYVFRGITPGETIVKFKQIPLSPGEETIDDPIYHVIVK